LKEECYGIFTNTGTLARARPRRRLLLEKLTEFLDYVEPKIDEYNDLLSFNQIFN
jgi:hypothetical protein